MLRKYGFQTYWKPTNALKYQEDPVRLVKPCKIIILLQIHFHSKRHQYIFWTNISETAIYSRLYALNKQNVEASVYQIHSKISDKVISLKLCILF